MGIVDCLILGMVLLAVVLVSVRLIRRKNQGSGGCGCCPYRGNCADRPLRDLIPLFEHEKDGKQDQHETDEIIPF